MVRAARRHLVGLGFCLGVLIASGTEHSAHAQTRTDFEKARAAYQARNYPEAEERLRALVDPKTGFKERLLLSQSRMYLGATLLAEGKNDPAQEVFEELILEDPSFEPDPLSFPGDVVNTFIDVRATLQDRLRQAQANAAKLQAERKARAEAEQRRQEEWNQKVREMAQEEKTTVKNQRLVAFVPFGAGQFQNRQPALGWVFLSTEAALVVAAGITVPMSAYAARRANEENITGDIDGKALAYKTREENIRTVNLSLVGAFAAIAVAGIVQANLAFVDEFNETKKRPLPPLTKGSPVSLAPLLSPLTAENGTASGGMIGVTGSF